MRTMWKGAISFGLVHIPIKLYPATSRQNIKFNYLHNECRTPVKYEKYCPVCKTKVEHADIVKGYEYEDGKYVVITDEDLENLPVETNKTISIINFVDLKEIDPVFFDKSYYLAPNEGGQKAFELLKQSMKNTKKAAISKVVIRSRETLSAVRVSNENIIMETMFYADEIRSAKGISELDYNVEIHDNELKMAVNLIENLSEKFQPKNYENNYRQALMDVIQKKIAGEQIEIPQKPQEGNVVDLMEALKASIEAAKGEKDGKDESKKEKKKQRKTS